MWWQNLKTNKSSALLENEHATWPLTYSSVIDTLIFAQFSKQTKIAVEIADLWLLNLSQQKPDLWPGNSPENEHQADYSPDGKWIAYTSDLTGKNTVFVKPSSGAGQPLQVGAGMSPAWNPQNGNALFYRDGKSMMRAELQIEPELQLLGTTELFPDVYLRAKGRAPRCYDIAKDGSRFLMIELLAEPPPVPHLRVIVNWFDEVKTKIPTGGSKQP